MLKYSAVKIDTKMPEQIPITNEQDHQLIDEVVSGRNVNLLDITQAVYSTECLVKLNRANLVPGHIKVNETEIVLQRHGQYIRDREEPNVGSLTEEAIQAETESAASYFTELFNTLPEEELKNTYILFVSSDTKYANGGKRSYETVSIAQKVAETFLDEKGVSQANILNNSHRLKAQGSPRPMAQLREPQVFDESPNFIEFMKGKYGDLGKDFWIAFEEDVEKEARLSMGAEGPDEIANRMKIAIRVLARYSSLFHVSKPDSRLIIWAGTHYDTISPFVKRDVLHREKTSAVLVDYGGGITIDINDNKGAIANVDEQQYPIDL